MPDDAGRGPERRTASTAVDRSGSRTPRDVAAPVVRRLPDLAGPDGWLDTTIPGSTPPVSLLRLHLDDATKASVSLVRFPVGWSRPGVGHYTVGEEFVVLRGGLVVSGVTHRPGDVVYLPAGTARHDSSSAAGALALAWFSGPPSWHVEPDDCEVLPGERSGAARAGQVRAPHPAVLGHTSVVETLAGEAIPVDRDVLALTTYDWTFIPAGLPAPSLPGPLLSRAWGP